MKRLARLGLVAGALALSACCGDTEATVLVHVIDGETGNGVNQPTVTVDGTAASCNDSVPYSAPAPTDDGGTVVNPPPGDLGVPPPPTTHFCETFVAYVDADGQRTVHVSASGYYGTEVQVDTGNGGGTFSCPSPTDAELTIALYRRPQ